MHDRQRQSRLTGDLRSSSATRAMNMPRDFQVAGTTQLPCPKQVARRCKVTRYVLRSPKRDCLSAASADSPSVSATVAPRSPIGCCAPVVVSLAV